MRRSKNLRSLQLRVFRCPECGTRLVAPKRIYRTSIGHIKTMWCYVCKAMRDFIQVE